MRRHGAAVFITILAAAGVAGCQKVTNAVTTSVSPCFRVLPQARTAVGNQGTIVDVVRLRGRQVTTFGGQHRTSTTVANRPGQLTPSGGASGAGAAGGGEPGVSPAGPAAGVRRDVCVIAFRGTFDPARIQHLVGAGQSGRYAVVIVGVQAQQVRAVLLTDALPKPLRAH
jgi:hypothetical protein